MDKQYINNNMNLLKKSKSNIFFIMTPSIIAIIALSYIGYKEYFGRFDIQHLMPDKNFEYTDEMSCQVVYSTYRDLGESSMKYYSNNEFSVTGLTTGSPQLTIDGFSRALINVRDGEYTSTFITEAISDDIEDSSVEMIQFHKLDGTFVRTFVGTNQYFGPMEVFHPEGFHLVIAQKGRCE